MLSAGRALKRRFAPCERTKMFSSFGGDLLDAPVQKARAGPEGPAFAELEFRLELDG